MVFSFFGFNVKFYESFCYYPNPFFYWHNACLPPVRSREAFERPCLDILFLWYSCHNFTFLQIYTLVMAYYNNCCLYFWLSPHDLNTICNCAMKHKFIYIYYKPMCSRLARTRLRDTHVNVIITVLRAVCMGISYIL